MATIQQEQHIRNQLTLVEQTLKQEFFGINHVIEHIIKLITPWLIYPHMQNRPLIINLWGMTGVGKTSLVMRLTELLDLSNKTFRFDMGETERYEYALNGRLYDIYRLHNGKPVVICLDEFQQARTIVGGGVEIAKSESRVIWELLDAGVLHITEFNYSTSHFFEYYHALELMLAGGVKAEKGIVIKEHKLYKTILSRVFPHYNLPVKDNNELVPEQILTSLQNISRKRCLTIQVNEKTFSTKNEKEILEILTQLAYEVSKPVKLDCRKSIIFISGNLDDAFHMNREINPDVDADVLHKASLKINVGHIKKCLQQMFRSEQIARLGNIHLIYPSLSKKAYHQIIHKALSEFKLKIKETCGLEAHFEKEFIDLIYREGVYPAQGTRPLFSTMQHLAFGQLGVVLNEYQEKCCKGKTMKWNYAVNKIEVQILHRKKKEAVITIIPQLSLEHLRESRNDEWQTIVAVHESGHAVVSMALHGACPDQIYSVTGNGPQNGFTLFSHENHPIINRKSMMYELAVNLGGYAAEQLIFGSEYVTSGSSDDLRKATQQAMQFLSKCGLGDEPGVYQKNLGADESLLLSDLQVQQQVQTKLRESLMLAEKALRNHYTLFLALCKYLSEQRSIDKLAIMRMISETDPQLFSQINQPQTVYKTLLQIKLEKSNRLSNPSQRNVEETLSTIHKTWLYETE